MNGFEVSGDRHLFILGKLEKMHQKCYDGIK